MFFSASHLFVSSETKPITALDQYVLTWVTGATLVWGACAPPSKQSATGVGRGPPHDQSHQLSGGNFPIANLAGGCRGTPPISPTITLTGKWPQCFI